MKNALLLFLVALLTGCQQGPPQGTIGGVVTLNGEPVDGGLIRLVPANGDSQPADCIIKQGKYEITMPTGDKKVELYWLKGGSTEVPDTASQGTQPKGVQMFPPKYNTQTEEKHTIVEGKVPKNFEIKLP